MRYPRMNFLGEREVECTFLGSARNKNINIVKFNSG